MVRMEEIVFSRIKDCPDDIKTVAHWYYQEWDSRTSNVTILDTIDELTKFDERIGFVAHINGKPVGAGEISFASLPNFSAYKNWIDGIYVPNEYRGLGISNALIEFAITEAKALKLSILHLRCEEHLIQLYEKHGFKVTLKDGNKFLMEMNI